MLAKLADDASGGRRVSVRAQVGRLPRHCVSRRVRRLHSEPGPAAARSLLSRAARRVPGSCRTGCVVDGEIVIATPDGLDFDALQLRLHPAASRAARLAQETPAAFVAFDLLAAGGRDVRASPQTERRDRLAELLSRCRPPDSSDAGDPRSRRRGRLARRASRAPGWTASSRSRRTASTSLASGRCSRSSTSAPPTASSPVSGGTRAAAMRVGSLLLGLYDEAGTLHHVGVTSSFTMDMRKRLVAELAPLRRTRSSIIRGASGRTRRRMRRRMPGGHSRWSAGKDLSWEPVRIERVCEVKYDHLQGPRFRHATIFLRWRPDKAPSDCRYDQLEITTPYELEKVFGAGRAHHALTSRRTLWDIGGVERSPDPGAARPVRAADSRGCASTCETGHAWRRRGRRRAVRCACGVRVPCCAIARARRGHPPSSARGRSR